MGLKLTPKRKLYKEFKGGINSLPNLIKDNRIPMNISQLMKKKIEVIDYKDGDDVRNSYLNHNFCSGDAIAFYNGKFKIHLDSPYLREITSKSSINDGALRISKKEYNEIDAEEFDCRMYGKSISLLWDNKQIKQDPVWKIVSRDNYLLNDFIERVAFNEDLYSKSNPVKMKVNLYYNGNNMLPEIKMLSIGGLDRFMSLRGGGESLYCKNNYIIGIALEELNIMGKGYPVRKDYITELQSFDNAIKGLGKTLHPDVIKPFVELRKKL